MSKWSEMSYYELQKNVVLFHSVAETLHKQYSTLLVRYLRLSSRDRREAGR